MREFGQQLTIFGLISFSINGQSKANFVKGDGIIQLMVITLNISTGSSAWLAESAQFHFVDIGGVGSLHLCYPPASIPATSLIQGRQIKKYR